MFWLCLVMACARYHFDSVGKGSPRAWPGDALADTTAIVMWFASLCLGIYTLERGWFLFVCLAILFTVLIFFHRFDCC